MARGDEVFIHKVQRNDKIDSIIESYYGVLPNDHMCAMREHIGILNQTHSAYTLRPSGQSVSTEPYPGEFLILPSEKTIVGYDLKKHSHFLNGFKNHPFRDASQRQNLRLDFTLRADVNRFQEKFDPLMAIAFCEISDGICNILSQKQEHREYFKEYTTDYFKESGEKIAERGAEFYASINAVEGLLVKYSSADGMAVRQGLKKEIIKAHKEMTKNLTPLVKEWAQKYTKQGQYRSLTSSNKAMDLSDLYAKAGAPRPVILKKSFDTYLKFMKYGKWAPALGTLADFVDANYDAYKDYKLVDNKWQKNLFKKDAGVLGLIIAGEVMGVIIIASGMPLLLGAVVTVAVASEAAHWAEVGAEKFYDGVLK